MRMLPADLLFLLVSGGCNKCFHIEDYLVQDGRCKSTNVGLFSNSVNVQT